MKQTCNPSRPSNNEKNFIVHCSLFIVHLAILLLSSTIVQAQWKYLQDVNDIPPHPRILMLAGEEQQIKSNIAADPVWAKMHQSIIAECDNMVPLPVSERIVEGRRLLGVSREVLRRVFYLSYAYRMTGQEAYAGRAEREMLAVSAFSDWNPSHFLDVAEMTMALAIGYDWLYDRLSPTTRDIIKTAILRHGLDPSLNSDIARFLTASHNWNQVCNAGLTFGALAVFEELPELSKMIIDRAVETIHQPMKAYAPDGVYPEGYGYWDYGTSFNVMFISALEKIWQTDFALSQRRGFMQSAAYITHMIGATGNCFNFADNGLGGDMHPVMFWFAAKTKDSPVLWNQRKYIQSDRKFTYDRLLPAVMIWGSGIRMADIGQPKDLMWAGRGQVPVALMRTSWTDPRAIYVGFKGGSGRSNHGHMDVGSFVMEADGVRWASDFGPQDYNSLETKGIDLWSHAQNSDRWQVFRYNNYVHNTLTINNQLHFVDGFADMVSWSPTTAFMNAIVDMSKVFDGQLSQSLRGVAIVNGQYVAVRDELTASDKEATVRWTMLTSAEASIKGKNTIELKKDGKKLTLQVVEPAQATMKTWSTASPHDYDAPNPGTVLVGFEVKVPAHTKATLLVKLIPQNAKQSSAKIPELKDWPKSDTQVTYIAHRGASYDAPENTVASAQLAWKMNTDAVEIDIHLSKDNEIMVIHDGHTQRITDENYIIMDTDSKVLRTLDAGSLKDIKFKGEKIPFFEEIIETIPQGKKLVVELKSRDNVLPKMEQILRNHPKLNQLIFISFDKETIIKVKKAFPVNLCYWLCNDKALLLENIQSVADAGLDGINLHYNIIDEQTMELAKKYGLDMISYTVNDPEQARRLIQLGVKQITSDRPEWLKNQLK